MLKKVLSLFVVVLLVVSVNAQDVYKKAPITKVTGEEFVPATENIVPVVKREKVTTVKNNIEITVVPTGFISDYDLQSNGTADQIIQDNNDPDRVGNVHIYWMRRLPGSTARSAQYLFSDDFGETWIDFGQKPAPPETGGFPTIDVNWENGAAVIGLHTNAGGVATRTQYFVDQDAGVGTFTRFDPDNVPSDPPAQAIWPRLTTLPDGKVAFVASVSGGTGAWTNAHNGTAFAGWVTYPGDQAETYQMATSEDGSVVAHIYIGEGTDIDRNIFYRESTDGGATWSPAVEVYGWREADSLGGLRGLDVVFDGETPHVVFERAKVTRDGSYFPSATSTIMHWSPDVNNGAPQVIASEDNIADVGFNPNAPAVFTPICRPSIGVASDGRGLFAVYNVSSGVYDATFNGTDSVFTAYFDNYLSLSTDGGETWSTPVKINPDEPMDSRRDYRFVNISKVNQAEGDFVYLHIVTQARDTAGIFIQEGPAGPPAELVYIQAKVNIPASSINETEIPSNFELSQNFPNPFNPSTTINFSIPVSGNVVLKVYDILGREVSSLVNEVKEAGKHTINFDASNLNSGMYIYKLTVGNFTSSKKMMLVK